MPSTPASNMPQLPPADHTENLAEFDPFADVSHHGSSLFELLALPNHHLDDFAPPPHTSLNEALNANSVSHTTAHASDHHRSASTSPPHPPLHPGTPATANAVESFCTADPSDPSHSTTCHHPSHVNDNKAACSSAPPHVPLPTVKQRRPSKGHPPRSPPVATRRTSFPPGKAISKPRPAANGKTVPKRKKVRQGAQSPVPTNDASNRSRDGWMNDSFASEQSDERPHGGIATQRRVPSNEQANIAGEASSLLEDGQTKDTHNSHTRRCRAKVNSKFQELLSILPAPPANTGIKHKAQILDYTIRVFRDIHARKTLLEAELALSSRHQLNTWIGNVINRSFSLQEALAPYLKLICTKGGWKYSEAWVPVQEPNRQAAKSGKPEQVSAESRVFTPSNLPQEPSKLRLGLAVIPSLGNTDDPDLQLKLEKFRDRSRSFFCRARVDLPGRIMCTMRPEWLPSLEDEEAFQRACLARASTLVVCFGVPIFVRGRVAAVAVFFDTEQRPYDAKCLDLADNIAGLLGNAFGASTLRKASM